MRRATSRTVALAAAALLLTALSSCSGGGPATQPGHAVPAPAAAARPSADPSSPPAPLRAGERFRTLAMPGGSYTPAAPPGGQDEYRCFLMDPGLRSPTFVTGAGVLPGASGAVHHAILFQVAPDQVGDAERADARDPGLGWTCFGGTGLPGRGGAGAVSALDSAPWLAAWAPGSGENLFGAGTGVRLAAGSRIVLQVHYNLRAGHGADNTSVRLRLASGNARLKALQTMLLVAPVELPCTPSEAGPLCDRGTAVLDLMRRFGAQAGRTVAGLQLLCGGNLLTPVAGPTQHCDRRVRERLVVRAVAGHMHLLGRSIEIELNPGTPRARTLLDRRVWNFDDQRATPMAQPVTVRPGDDLRVTCTHDARLRSMLPELRREPPRYVTWGEGTSDEMCLGIVVYTRT